MTRELACAGCGLPHWMAALFLAPSGAWVCWPCLKAQKEGRKW